MKKIRFYIVGILAFFWTSSIVLAAGSATLSVSSSTIENGRSVTASVTLKSTAAWNITIYSSGATSGCTEKFVGDSGTGNNITKTFSVTCKSTSTGIISFSMSGDITNSDGVNVKISGSRSVKVVTPREKSANNKLQSLSVTGYDISPTFNANTNEYIVTVPSTVEKITINATKVDKYSSLEGIGEHSVNEGANKFDIVVTSETGISNIYKLTVTVEDLNPIEVEVDGIKYTLVKEIKNLTKPELYDETTIKVNDIDIPAFKNDILNYNLVGLKDPEGNISLYIYEENNYSKYNEFISDKLTIVFLNNENAPKFFTKSTLSIEDEEVIAYKYKSITLVYGINVVSGEKAFYNYDAKDKTIQVFDLDLLENNYNTNQTYKYLSYGLAACTTILIAICVLLTVNKHKYQKIVEEKVIDKKANDKKAIEKKLNDKKLIDKK